MARKSKNGQRNGSNDEEAMKPMEISSSVETSSAEGNWQRPLLVATVGAFLLVVAAAGWVLGQQQQNHSLVNDRNLPVFYPCPTHLTQSIHEYQKEKFELYEKQDLVHEDMDDFLENFRKKRYDEWGYTYNHVKKGMYDWKSKVYPDNINDGDTIYESAMGLGLNTYMTLEILNEVKNLTNVTIYGNEYVDVSTAKANILYDRQPPFDSRKGEICVADSTNLYFVPSNAFDLVFTGYLATNLDPLNVAKDHPNNTLDENYEIYFEWCDADPQTDPWKYNKAEEAQAVQEDWFGLWVSEMVRIAKPGAAVIVEQVSLPLCSNYEDWGGVNPQYWEPAIAKYGWDVDPTSLDFMEDHIFGNRYHVFMKKNPAQV